MTGVAVKLTVVPGQTGLASAKIETLTGTEVFTDMVMALEVAGLPEGQEIFDVILQVITSPLAGVYVKVLP